MIISQKTLLLVFFEPFLPICGQSRRMDPQKQICFRNCTAGRFAAGIEKAFFFSHSVRLKQKILRECEVMLVWKKIVAGAGKIKANFISSNRIQLKQIPTFQTKLQHLLSTTFVVLTAERTLSLPRNDQQTEPTVQRVFPIVT